MPQPVLFRKILRYSLFIAGMLIHGYSVKAQSPVDSVKNIHSVRRATISSALLPGAGQVYNHKIWKVPIIYAAFAGMGYLIKFNNDNYKKYNKALIARLDSDPATVDLKYATQYTDANLATLSDYYHRNRDLSIVLTGVIYLLNIVDAHVDAHLYYFDITDDLSLEVQPILIPINSYTAHSYSTAGLNFKFSF